MSGPPRELALSLLVAARDHPDLTVKLASLRQVKDILSFIEPPSLAAELLPPLIDLQASPESLVRKLLIEICEENGLKFLDYLSIVMPVLLTLAKDDDPIVACQSIVSSIKLFSTILEEMTFQFHRHGQVERWAGEVWTWMVKYKDVVYSILFEPVSVGTRLLALKFLETYVLVFTPDMGDSDKPTLEGKKWPFSISWVPNGHPLLERVVLTADSNKFLFTLLDLLGPNNSLPGPLTIAVINCLATIARKRPQHYHTVFSALLDFNSNFETSRGVHAASVHYSLRTAFLGFLRCTHLDMVESRDKLLRALRAMNAGDAADQVLRVVDKMMKNNERALRDARLEKDDQPSSVQADYGDVMKRKPSTLDDVEHMNGPESGPKRIRYSAIDQCAQPSEMQDCDHSTVNGPSANAPFLNDNLTPAEKMIAMIGAFLCEGERGAESLELLISQMHPDLLADIVITNMKHLPKAPPSLKPGNLPGIVQNGSTYATQGITSASTPAQASGPATPDGLTSPTVSSASVIDLSASTNLSADPRHGPRRDPRRLDPRRMAVPIDGPSKHRLEETTRTTFVSDAPVSLDKPLAHFAASADNTPGSSVSNVESDGDIMRNSMIPDTDQVMAKAAIVDEIKGTSSPEIDMTVDSTISSADLIDKNPVPLILSVVETTDLEDAPSELESDEHLPVVLDIPASHETHEDLPEIPPYVELSDDQHQAVGNFAIEQIIRSYKCSESRNSPQITLALVARLVSQMDSEHMTALVKKDIILDYKHKQGHELVMLVLYHLHTSAALESSDQFVPPDAYEKFLLGVAKVLLDTFPTTDRSFSRLLGEAPVLPNSILELLDSLCSSDGSEQWREENRDADRISQGLGTVWSLILGRPVNREACLNIALKCAVHRHDDVRAKAIRLVANKLYPLRYITKNVEQYAIRMLLSAVDSGSSLDQSSYREAEVVCEKASISGSILAEPGSSTTNPMEGANPASLTSVSSSEAQRLMSLYFALCTKRPSLLHLVFDVYGRAPKIVKQTMQDFLHHIPILTGATGSPSPEILRIISDPPNGSEDLLRLVLELLMKRSPSPELIATGIHLYETKLKDATILIPMLSSLSKHEVLPIFPRLVDLSLDKFQRALDPILQGSAHSGPALTPAEALVALHDIVPEKEGIALKKVMDACSACFEQRMVFTEQVLAKALSEMVEKNPLPLLFMRTVIQAIDAYPTLVDFVMEILSKLVFKQIWKMPKLWVGFLKCASQTQPHSFKVLLQLPVPQLENALNKHPSLRGSLAAYANQPKIRASLPRSTLVVLGLSSEHLPRLPSHLNSPDTSSSIHGATLT
ncbi:hypothetical protein Dimus_027908 [Dionaea muscipula]